MSSKDLAETIGLSQSQMSRLEKGQRRVDAEILNKIANALNVSPSYFFEDNKNAGPPDVDVEQLNSINQDIGRLIRTERRKRHYTAEQFGAKIGRNGPFIQALEEGKMDMVTPELIQKICKVLKMDPSEFFVTQQGIISQLKKQVLRLNKAFSDSTRGNVELAGDSAEDATVTRQAIPVMGSVFDGYPREFGPDGLPLSEVDEYVFVPGVNDPKAFAVCVVGDQMVQNADPSFKEGDIAIFSPQAEVLSRDFVFVRPEDGTPQFCQIFFDSGGQIRLQPLNTNYPPTFHGKQDILGWWKMVARIERF